MEGCEEKEQEEENREDFSSFPFHRYRFPGIHEESTSHVLSPTYEFEGALVGDQTTQHVSQRYMEPHRHASIISGKLDYLQANPGA